MAVDIDIAYQGDLHCKATHRPSGKSFLTDAPLDNGGKADTFSPTDLVATALGTCILTVMDLTARRHDLDITGTTVHVTKEMASTPVRRIGAITVTITMAKNFSAEDRARLELAGSSCPVKQTLHPDVNVNLKFVYPA